MIQGMAQMQFEKMPSFNEKSKSLLASNEKSFGSMLAAITKNEPIAVSSKESDNTAYLQVSKLLQITTIEELQMFLRENNEEKIELPIDVLDNVESEPMAMNTWSFLDQLEKAGTALYSKIGEEPLEEGNQSKEKMIPILALLQLATFELPKFDLTIKQERQRETLQTILQNISGLVESNSNKPLENGSLRLPFMEPQQSMQFNDEAGALHSQKEIANKAMGQSALSLGGIPKIEGLLTESEARENSRAQLLIRELQNVFKRSNFGQLNGVNRITVKMYPEHLGQLRIELLQTNGLLTARILASNALGKEMLESQLHQLRNAFLQQNIQVERIDISQMLNDTTYLDRENAFGQQFKNEQENAKKQNDDQDEEEQLSFEQYLIELEV